MSGERWLGVAPPESITVDEFVVRRYGRGDAAALVGAVTRSIEHLRPWMPWIRFEPQTVEQRAALIEEWSSEWDARTNFTMGIFEKEQLVGGTGFHLRGGEGVLEIGYWVHVDHTRRSIATRVSRALTEVAFGIDDVLEVRIGHDINNETSGRVPMRLGFGILGEHEREPEAPGEAGRVRLWSMTRERWASLATTRER